MSKNPKSPSSKEEKIYIREDEEIEDVDEESIEEIDDEEEGIRILDDSISKKKKNEKKPKNLLMNQTMNHQNTKKILLKYIQQKIMKIKIKEKEEEKKNLQVRGIDVPTVANLIFQCLL